MLVLTTPAAAMGPSRSGCRTREPQQSAPALPATPAVNGLPLVDEVRMPGRRDNSGDVLSFYARSAPMSEMTLPHRHARKPACIRKGALRNNDG